MGRLETSDRSPCEKFDYSFPAAEAVKRPGRSADQHAILGSASPQPALRAADRALYNPVAYRD